MILYNYEQAYGNALCSANGLEILVNKLLCNNKAYHCYQNVGETLACLISEETMKSVGGRKENTAQIMLETATKSLYKCDTL